MSLSIKPGAKITGLSTETLWAMRVAEGVFEDRGLGRMVITSCTDGTHGRGSKHYIGGAFDIRTRDFSPEQVQLIASDLRERLGVEFDVVVEKDHVHTEHDPKTPINS